MLKVKVKSLSHVRLFATQWTVALQTPLPMGFSRQEYWSGLPFPSSGDLPDPGIEPWYPALQADALTSEPPGKACLIHLFIVIMLKLKREYFGIECKVWRSNSFRHHCIQKLKQCSNLLSLSLDSIFGFTFWVSFFIY